MRQPSKPKRKTAKPAPSPRPGTGKKRTAVKNAGMPASTSAEARQLLLIRILETLNHPSNIKNLTHDILEMIKEHTGVKAIGLRLREGEDFPYVDIIGLSAGYLKDEGALCARGPGGEVVRDGVGYPVLECLCGAVLQGRTDPALPSFTPGGSFWANDLSRFIVSTPDVRRPSRMRNRCLSEGYKSVALIPLRSGKDIVGLLQLNDKRPGRFTLEGIRFLERIGSSIAITVSGQKSLEALKASQDLLRAVISGTSDAVYVRDIQGRYLLFNDAAAQIIGKAALGVAGQEEPLLFAPDKESVEPDRDQTIIQGEKTVTVEESITTRSGKTRTYLSTKGPLFDDRGRVSGMFTIAHDITERKEMEKALKESHGRYLGLFDNASFGIFHSLPEGRFLRVNSAMASMLGYDSPEDLITSVTDIRRQIYLRPEKHPVVLRTVLEKTGWVYAENEYRRKDGTAITGKLTARRVQNADGSLAYIEGFVEDITERKRAEDALRESELRYRSLFQQTHDAVFILDLQGRFLEVNRGGADLLGYSPEEMHRLTYRAVSAQVSQSEEVLAKMLRGERIPLYERLFRKKNGDSVPVEITVQLVRDTNGRPLHIQSVAREVTERKKAEAALLASKERYRQLVEQSKVGIGISHKNEVIFANPALLSMFGYDRLEEFVKVPLLDHIAPSSREMIAEMIENRGPGEVSSSEFVYDILRKDGQVRTLAGTRSSFSEGEEPYTQTTFQDITERKRAEEALRESEERFKSLFDDAVLGLYQTTPEGEIRMANPALCRMLGYDSFEELQNRNLEEDGFHPGYPRERFKKEIEEKGVIIGLEASWDLRGGGRIFVSESARAIKDASGRVLYYEGSVEDITERHRAVDALRESEEKFKNLSERSPNMIFINRKGKVVYVNDVCEQTMGYSRHEFYAPDFDFRRIHTQESESAVRASFADHLAGRESPPYEVSLVTKDGRCIEAILTTKLIDFENEKAILGILTDITEQKRIQKALQQGEERFRQLVENMSSGVVVYEARDDGRDFIIKDFNRSAERIEGVARQDIMGRSVLDVFPGVADFGLFEVFRRVWRTGAPEYLPAGVYRDQRVVGWRENYVYRLPSDEVVAIYDDVTERKKAEEEIRSLNIELEERIRRRTALLEATNRELEAFVYSVSHDLQAPLRTIDGFALAFLEETGSRLDERGRHFLNRIRAASQNMERLIVDLLKLSRVTRAEMTYAPVNLSGIVEKLAAELRAAHPDRKVEWVIAHGVKAEGNGQLLESALRNLMDNANKFTAKHASARIEFGVQDQGGQKAYFVRDDGAGFDMAYADKLFSVFQRLHKAEDFEGTGVGLAIVQRIIHRHGGRVWAEGAVEQGATFYFSLAPGNSAEEEGGKDGSE